jgi:hypothetical protein
MFQSIYVYILAKNIKIIQEKNIQGLKDTKKDLLEVNTYIMQGKGIT